MNLVRTGLVAIFIGLAGSLALAAPVCTELSRHFALSEMVLSEDQQIAYRGSGAG